MSAAGRLWQRLAVAALCFALVALFSRTRLCQTLENKTLDVRFALRDGRTRSVESPVVIVGVDARTLEARPDPVALNEGLADGLRAAAAGGATAIGFDVLHLFAVDPERCKTDRGAFVRAIVETGRMTVPYTLTGDVAIPTYVSEFMAAGMGVDAAAVSRFNADAKLKLLDAAERALPVRFGYANIDLDEHGTARELRLAARAGGEALPSFSLAVFLRHAGLNRADVKINGAALTAGRLTVPLSKGKMLLDYAGPPGAFPRVSLEKVLAERNDLEALKKRFAGKIVLIGALDQRFADFHATPYSAARVGTTRSMYGVEIVANAVHALATRRFARTLSPGANAALIAGAVAASIFLLAPAPLWAGLPALALLEGGLAALAQFGFGRHVWIPAAPLLIAPAFSFLIGWLHNALALDRDKRRLRAVFHRYVDPRIVREAVRAGDASLLTGARREITVLFSDIRGFTSLSEKLPPERVVETLNVHLSRMTSVILESGGLVDKYVGDCVMAVWNVPADQENHRLRACEAALNMAAALREVNAELRAKGILNGEDLRIGVGINSGEAVVGNIGSDKKSDYTAIGDAVNVAARLEGLNKEKGTTILAGEDVVRGLEDRLDLRDLGEAAVKGRDKPVRVFEIRGLRG